MCAVYQKVARLPCNRAFGALTFIPSWREKVCILFRIRTVKIRHPGVEEEHEDRMAKVNLPYGIDNFAKVRASSCYYTNKADFTIKVLPPNRRQWPVLLLSLKSVNGRSGSISVLSNHHHTIRNLFSLWILVIHSAAGRMPLQLCRIVFIFYLRNTQRCHGLFSR